MTVLERHTRVSTLGVRLWDPVSAKAITDGIVMRELTRGGQAFPNGSGVLVAASLPRVRAAEFGAGDEAYWLDPPARARVGFEVGDRQERFHPFRFEADVPHKGLFTPPCALQSPLQSPAGTVPLFSLPQRPLPPGMAAVRAQLVDHGTGEPAAFALLRVTPAGGPTATGLADREGRVLVPVPYPEPTWNGSSPPAGTPSLSEQTWDVTLSIAYSALVHSPLRPDADVPPDLCTVLAQGPGRLLASVSPSTELTHATLAFGQDLVLRSAALPVLLATPEV